MRNTNLRAEKPAHQFGYNQMQGPSQPTANENQNMAGNSDRATDDRTAGQFVQQVIYNQGSVVINNPTSSQAAQFQMMSQQPKQIQNPGAKVATASSGHQKTKSTSFVVGQGGILMNNGALSYGRQNLQQPPMYQIDLQLSKQINYSENMVVTKDLAPSAPKQTESQSFNQRPQEVIQPSHKKSQSMINSKIANLLLKGSKKSVPNVNPQMIQNHSLQVEQNEITKSIEMMMCIKNSQNNTYSDRRSVVDTEDDVMFKQGFNQHQLVRDSNERYKNSQQTSFQAQPPTHVRQHTAGVEASFFKNLDFSARGEIQQQNQKRLSSSRPVNNSIPQSGTPYNVAQAKIKSRTADKIASNGKIVASGVAVKKPQNLQKIQQPSYIAIQQVPLTAQHHRVKSDQHQSHKSKEMLVSNINTTATIQQQKGKVGKILKNNFVETAVHGSGSFVATPIPILNNNLAGQTFTLQQKNIIRTFQQPPTTNNPIPVVTNAQQQQSFAEALQKNKKKSVSFNNPVLSSSRQKIVKEVKRQSTKAKYQELQSLYNELLEKHVNLLTIGGSVNSGIITNEQSANSSFHLKQNQQQLLKNKISANYAAASSSTEQIRSLKSKETSQERNSSWDPVNKNADHQNNQVYPPPGSSTNSGFQGINFSHSFVQMPKKVISSNMISLNSEEGRFQQLGEPSQRGPIVSEQSNTKQNFPVPQTKANQAILFQNQKPDHAQLIQTLMKQSAEIMTKQSIIQDSLSPNSFFPDGLKASHIATNPASKYLAAASHRRSASDGASDQNQIKFNKQNRQEIKQNTEAQKTIQRPSETVEVVSSLNQKNFNRNSATNRTENQISQDKKQSKSQNRQTSEERNLLQVNEEFRKQQVVQIPVSMIVDLTRTVEQPVQKANSKKRSYMVGAIGVNSKFRVTEQTEVSEEEDPAMRKSIGIQFHHPKLSGNNWLRPEQAMVILENTPSQSSQISVDSIEAVQQRQKLPKVSQVTKQVKGPLINNLLLNVDQNVNAVKGKGPSHVKNKLSANSDNSAAIQRQEKSNEVMHNYADQCKPDKPTHKRVKSDAVESIKLKLIPNETKPILLTSISNPNSSGQRSQKSLPKKKKDMPQTVFDAIKNNQPNTKEKDQIVYVSIDDLHEIGDESKNKSAANWLQVPAVEIQKQNWQHGVITKFHKEKRESTSQDRAAERPNQNLSLLQPENPVKLDKYKQILKKAKQNFHSKSEVPTIIQIQEASSRAEEAKLTDMEIQRRKNQLRPTSDKEKSNKVKNFVDVAKSISVAPQNSLNTSLKQTPQDQRIETSESIDINIPPETKVQIKLIHHIKNHYAKDGVCPETTVDFYKVGKILGKGAFGKVNLSLHQLTQQLVAIKSINKTHFSESSQSKKVMQEVMILKQTRHQNIVQLYEYFETQKHILFVIGLSDGGDLLGYVRKRRQLKEDVAKSVFKQLIEGLKYCHSKNILHRDIKLDNILLSAEGEIKICDFGVSKIIRKGEKMSEQCGTPAYIAPEILIDKGYEGFACDIWSAGVVLYAMLYGTVPFKANNMSELQKMIIKGKYTLAEGVSKEAKDLLNKLLEKDPTLRLTIPNILAHAFMKDAKDTVQLFTNAEKKYMKTEFSYIEGGDHNKQVTGDPFNDQMLDSCHNSMLKNAETKSIILAPFNSTKSNLEEIEKYYSLPSEIKDLIQSKSCLKFHARAKEIDQQYEVNNNAELDNGVYHDFNKDEKEAKAGVDREDSLEQDFKNTPRQSADGEKKKRQTELQKLEKMIKNQEGEEYSGRAMLNPSSILHNNNRDESEMMRVQAEAPLQIDDEVVQKVAEFGYPRDQLRKYLMKCELNNATTAYFLLQKLKHQSLLEQQEGISPI